MNHPLRKAAVAALISVGLLSAGAATATATPAKAHKAHTVIQQPTITFTGPGTVTIDGTVTRDLVFEAYKIDNPKCTGTAFTADCAPQTATGHVTIPAGDYQHAKFGVTTPLCGPMQQDISTGDYQPTVTYPTGTIGYVTGQIIQLDACHITGKPGPQPIVTQADTCSVRVIHLLPVDSLVYNIPDLPPLTTQNRNVLSGDYQIPANYVGTIRIPVIDYIDGTVVTTYVFQFTAPSAPCVNPATVHSTRTVTCSAVTWTVSVDKAGVSTLFRVTDTPTNQPYLQAKDFTVAPGHHVTVTMPVQVNSKTFTRGPDQFTLELLSPIPGNDGGKTVSTVSVSSAGCPAKVTHHTPAPPAPPVTLVKAPVKVQQLAFTGAGQPGLLAGLGLLAVLVGFLLLRVVRTNRD